MSEVRRRAVDEAQLDTVLAEEFSFDGTIEFSEPFLVKGKISGRISTTSDLYIAESADIAADITARRVTVKGKVQGDVDAQERVELFAGATLEGNILTDDLVIQSGSRFSGTCDMTGRRVKK